MAAVLAMLLYKLGTPQHQLKFGIGIVALIVVTAAALRPMFALALVIAALPFEFVVYGVGTDEALIFAVALVLLFKIDFRTVPGWIVIAALALVLGSLLSVFNAVDEGQALWGGIRWLGLFVLMFEAFTLLRDQPDAMRRFADLVCGSGAIVILFAFLQKQGITAIVGPEFQQGNVQSFFNYYTNYGGYAAMVAVIATGETLVASVAGERRRAWIFGVLTILCAVGVAISASRGALLALGVSWVVLVIFNARRVSVFVRLIGILVALALAGFVATPVQTRTHIVSRLSTPVGSQTEDIQRFGLQHLGEQAFAHNPLGLGFNNFRYLSAEHPTPDAYTPFDHAHRTPIQIGLDAGWLGLGGYALLFFGAIGVAMFGRGRGLRNLTCAAALVGAMAQGLNDYLYFDINLLAFFVALVFGSIWLPDASAQSPAETPLPATSAESDLRTSVV